MGVESIIIWLIVGAIAGWLAGMVVRGGGFGLIGDIVVGIIGAVIAGWLLRGIGVFIGGGFIAAVIDAFFGVVMLLRVVRLLRLSETRSPLAEAIKGSSMPSSLASRL